MKVVSKQRNSKMCFICGMDNPIGMKAQFYNMEDGSVMTPFICRKEYQSFPGRVHGGIVATMMDELGFRAMWAKESDQIFGVTMSLTVKYRRPVPYDELIIGKGMVVESTPRYLVIKAEIFDQHGTLLANSDVTYLKQDIEKIAPNTDMHEEMPYLIEDDVKEINFI